MPVSVMLLRAAQFFSLLLVVAPSWAQDGQQSEHAVFPCRLYAVEESVYDHGHPLPPVQALGQAPTAASATFEVTYNDFPPEAEAAFQAAVDIWAQHISSPVPIRIRATWEPLGTNILGSAGPFLFRGSSTPFANTWYPAALADALAGENLSPNGPDIDARFNSTFGRWYFGTDGNPPPDQFDLTTIVLHEIGHGLGFIGAFTVEGAQGTLFEIGNPPVRLPFIFDRFAEDALDRSLLDTGVYPRPSQTLAGVLQDAVLFAGNTVAGTFGEPAPLYTPSAWSEGTSYSHYDEAAFPTADANALLTPFIQRAEVIRNPGPLACAALQDLGWTLAEPCASQILGTPPPPTPLPGGFALRPVRGTGDTIVTLGRAEFRLEVEEAQQVQAWLFDTRGRQVATLADRPFQAREASTLTVDAAILPAGLYVLQVIGERFEATRKVVRLR